MQPTETSPYVPEAIRAQQAEAQRILKESQQAPPPAAPPEEQPAPTTAQPPAAPAAPVQPAPIVTEIAELEAKRDAIKNEIQQQTGRYGALLQKKDGMISDLQEIISRQEAEIAELRKGGTQQAPAAAESDEWRQHYTAEEIEQWGEAFCKGDYARIKRMTSKAQPAADSDRVKKLEKDIEATKRETAINQEREFLAKMDAILPGFSVLNGSPAQGIPADPRWTTFLDSQDPTTLVTWRQLAVAAFNQGNLARLAEIARKCMDNGVTPAKPAAPGGVRPLVPTLESQMAVPTVQSSAQNPGEPGQRVVRQSEINAFNAEIVANPAKYSPEERVRILNEFKTAMMAGRYVDDTAR